MNKKKSSDQRRYIRLKSVFFVKFTIIHLQEGIPGIGWRQGYTSNVSKEGIGLESTELNESTIKYLNQQDVYLKVRIYVPLTRTPINAVCEVAWFKEQGQEIYPSSTGLQNLDTPGAVEERFQAANSCHLGVNGQKAYFIGLKFRSISTKDLKKILQYAGWLRFIPDFLTIFRKA